MMALSANTSVIHFILCCFTFPPCVIARFAPTRVRIIAGRVQISASSGLIEEFAKLNRENADAGLSPVQHSHEYNRSTVNHIKFFAESLVEDSSLSLVWTTSNSNWVAYSCR